MIVYVPILGSLQQTRVERTDGLFGGSGSLFSCLKLTVSFQLSVEGFAVDKMAGEVKVRKGLLAFYFSIRNIKT